MPARKSVALAAAMVVGLGAGATTVAAQSHGYRTTAGAVITISCYRGPWEDVIWDRPNPVFIDSLVNAGYSFPEAHAIAERVCRDPSAVNAPGVMTNVMTNILIQTPPSR